MSLQPNCQHKTRKDSRVSSRIQCRIETLQSDMGVIGGELPVHRGPQAVPAILPGGDLGAQDIDTVDAPVQALANHGNEFDLGDVQPGCRAWEVWTISKRCHAGCVGSGNGGTIADPVLRIG